MSTASTVRQHPYQLPAWRGGVVLEDAIARLDAPGSFTYTLLGVRLARPLDDLDDDDDAAIEYLTDVLTYAWTQNMGGAPSIREGVRSIHDDVVVFDAPVALRHNVTRSYADATCDLLAVLPVYYAEGSPVRKGDQKRKYPRPVGVNLPDLRGVLIGG